MPATIQEYQAPQDPETSNDTRRLGRLLQIAFARQAVEVGRLLSPGILRGDLELPRELEYWPERLAEMAKPLMTLMYQQGIAESRQRLHALQGGRSAVAMFRSPQRITPHIRHTFGERLKQLGVSFDLFDPLV